LDSILLIGLLILVFIGLPIGLGLLFYFVPKKLGYPKTAKYLTIAYGLIVLTIGLFIAFEDQLFTKNNAKGLVEEQDFKLQDEFDLIKNESFSAIGDYYHTFTLKISERDRQEAILKITSSKDYHTSKDITDNHPYTHDRYLGPKITWNYENEYSYVREYFEPSGRQGYAPTFRRISISKTNNELTFEDIDE